MSILRTIKRRKLVAERKERWKDAWVAHRKAMGEKAMSKKEWIKKWRE